MQDLHTTVEGIKTIEGEVIHAVQKQLPYLKPISKATSQTAIGLATGARVIKNVITNAFTLQRTLQDLKTVIYFQSNTSRGMREFEFTALLLQQAFVQLQQGLETKAIDRLSSVLIPPYNLSKILQEVTFRLPHDVSLIAASDLDNVYYDVAAVQAYATPMAIRLAVCFP
jgi:hypothetical protein